MEAVLKTVGPDEGSGGSNPSLSALKFLETGLNLWSEGVPGGVCPIE